MKVTIQQATSVDVSMVVKNSHVASIPNAEAILARCMSTSTKVWVWSVDGKVGALWGLMQPTVLSDRAYLWMLSTDFVNEHVFLFVRYSQRLIAEMLEMHEMLVGHCELSNPKAIRWLRWLGAVFGEPEGQFIPFTIRRKDG
jgi:hypothetical protein